MIAAFRVYFLTQWASFVAYRVVFFLYAMWAILPPLIYLAVWSTVAGASGIAGWSRGEFVAYYLTFMVVNHLAGSIEIHTASWEIRQGEISGRLLLPIHPGVRTLASNVGYKAIGMFVVVPGVLLLAALFRPEYHTTPGLVVLGVLATLGAGALQFLVGYTVALLSFWITRADAVTQLNEVLLILLAGQIAPIALLPDALRALATALPYRYMLSFPVEVLTGRLGGGGIALGFGLQTTWTVAAWFLMRLVWRRGVRHYSAVGG
jgi:ABC-2 type transport system permease protein